MHAAQMVHFLSAYFPCQSAATAVKYVAYYLFILERILHIGRLIKILNTSIEKHMNHTLAEYDLTSAQGMIIGFLHRHQDQDICQRDLEVEFCLSHPTMSSILKRMEKKELIATTPLVKDKRYKKIILSAKGESLHMKIRAHIDEMEAKMRIDLSEEQQDELISLMNVVIRNISS
jgi:MarR family transcriptional regulator, repressor for mepA